MQVTLKQVLDNAPGDQFSKPGDGNRFLAVQMEFADVGTTDYSDSPTNGINLIDSTGQMWTSSYRGTTAGPSFAGSVDITPNDSRVGWVVFELPASQSPLKIQVALDSGFATDLGEWKLG